MPCARKTAIHTVICKCPTCWKLHPVQMESRPLVTPRIYCKIHERNRHDESNGFTVIGCSARRKSKKKAEQK